MDSDSNSDSDNSSEETITQAKVSSPPAGREPSPTKGSSSSLRGSSPEREGTALSPERSPLRESSLLLSRAGENPVTDAEFKKYDFSFSGDEGYLKNRITKDFLRRDQYFFITKLFKDGKISNRLFNALIYDSFSSPEADVQTPSNKIFSPAGGETLEENDLKFPQSLCNRPIYSNGKFSIFLHYSSYNEVILDHNCFSLENFSPEPEEDLFNSPPAGEKHTPEVENGFLHLDKTGIDRYLVVSRVLEADLLRRKTMQLILSCKLKPP